MHARFTRFITACRSAFLALLVRFSPLLARWAGIRWRLRRTMRRILPSRPQPEPWITFDADGICMVDVGRMRAGESVVIRTENSVYHIKVDIAGPPEVLVSGDRDTFSRHSRVLFRGSLPYSGGAAVFDKKIMRGLQLEFGLGGIAFVRTSPVQSIVLVGVATVDDLWSRDMHTDKEDGSAVMH